MASIITATNSSGLTTSADNSGVLQLASGTGNLVTVPSTTGTMALTASPTFTGTATIPTATITTLNAPSGVLATQNGMTGIAKAWVNFTGSATPTIVGSFNVSSITYNTTGDYTINFTTAMPNANYVITTMAEESRILTRKFSTAPTTSAFRLVNQVCSNAATADASYAFCAVHSS